MMFEVESTKCYPERSRRVLIAIRNSSFSI